MQALRFETIVPETGELQLKLPLFRPGDTVEVIVLPLHRENITADEFPLRHSVIEYLEPTEPVAEEDWAVFR